MSYEEIKEPTPAGQWSSGICDCFSDCRLCIVTTIPFINALSLGQGYTVLEGHKGIMDEPCCGIVVPTVGCCFLPLLLVVQTTLLRQKFRVAPYNVKGDCCGCPDLVEDAFCAFFCGWCVIQQAQRHMQANNKELKGPAYLFAPETTDSMDKST